jgi:hypothetical protein
MTVRSAGCDRCPYSISDGTAAAESFDHLDQQGATLMSITPDARASRRRRDPASFGIVALVATPPARRAH